VSLGHGCGELEVGGRVRVVCLPGAGDAHVVAAVEVALLPDVDEAKKPEREIVDRKRSMASSAGDVVVRRNWRRNQLTSQAAGAGLVHPFGNACT
jgi:hypothetical protein